MKIYGLIGNPLGHSFSKKYFTEKFSKENLQDCEYQNFEIKDLRGEIPFIKANAEIAGLNVTIPYKSGIISFLDNITAVCEEINACNCIKVVNGKWTGFNTDVIGFEKSFIPHLQPHHKKALVLGTGGSSKAVAYVLDKLNIQFLFVSRNAESRDNAITYDAISAKLMEDFTIVINTTPVGMHPNVDRYPQLPYKFVSNKHYFFDLIYNPDETLFLSKAAQKGATIENGKDMLAIQAEESWKIWNES